MTMGILAVRRLRAFRRAMLNALSIIALPLTRSRLKSFTIHPRCRENTHKAQDFQSLPARTSEQRGGETVLRETRVQGD